MERRTDGGADMTGKTQDIDILESAHEVLALESETLRHQAERLDASFADCCRLLASCSGRIIVIGMGKSGHIGQKIAATFASTGSPAFFVHPAEASHGDLGMILPNDVALALSHSGETPELLSLIPRLHQLGVALIAMTGSHQSTLARSATLSLELSIEREACPLNLAPTSSTTAALAMGDALAITLMRLRGFKEEDFAVTHPGGNLGKRLLTTVGDLMRQDDQIPRVLASALLRDALPEISSKGLGMTTVLDENEQLVGVFTDGDLRRSLADAVDIHAVTVAEVMTREFQHAEPSELAVDALHRMRDHHINAMPVLRDDQLVGAFNMHDLLTAGIR